MIGIVLGALWGALCIYLFVLYLMWQGIVALYNLWRAYTAPPFSLPVPARFAHALLVAGTGHGKTQCMQWLILSDLAQLQAGTASIIVIDSQGDLLRNILRLAEVKTLADRLVVIDPHDSEPPALNLLDFGLARVRQYDPTSQQRLLNGAVALYEYLFGALLGAELTMRQGVVFRYLARLLMTIPAATIYTLLHLVENPEAVRPHLAKLDHVSVHFFETYFFSPACVQTRQQIIARLWGVLSNSVLEQMFAHEKNTLDLFTAINKGSLILINTAKDLLKQEGCEIFGRFFIALTSQAVQERAVLSEGERRSTFVYIDEAADYFAKHDTHLESLFTQARKQRVGLVVALQDLDQCDQKLRSTVLANTATKIVGGVSAKDAVAFAKEMRCEPEFLQSMQKHQRSTEFACFIRNDTPAPFRLSVPFGAMENRPRLSDEEYTEILRRNRMRYCQRAARLGLPGPEPRAHTGFRLGRREVL